MATYFLHVKTLSRGKGSRVTRAAAYRAGERIRDERTSDLYNFSDRQDVAHKEIRLPEELADDAQMSWALDRATLWNAAEHAGKRRNSLLAREVLVILPPELNPAQRVALVRTFSQELADRYRNAVDFVIHQPRPGSDSRHHHAHLLMTTREVSPDGLGPRTTLELSGTERHARGLGPSKADYLSIRARWAQVTNEALREAGVAARITHRSLKDQGIDREPAAAIPQKVYYAERKSGVTTQAGDEIRARHRERVEARLRGTDEHTRVLQRQSGKDRERAIESARRADGAAKKVPRSALTREELNERRRQRHQANAQTLNQKRRERYRDNGQAERQKYRTWRQANAPEVNERRRLWRAANAERVNERAREYRQAHAEQDSAKRWLKMREEQEKAERSAQQPDAKPSWLERSTGADDALEDAKRWLAQSEHADAAEPAGPAAERGSRGRAFGTRDDDDDDDDGKPTRSRDYDFGL